MKTSPRTKTAVLLPQTPTSHQFYPVAVLVSSRQSAGLTQQARSSTKLNAKQKKSSMYYLHSPRKPHFLSVSLHCRQPLTFAFELQFARRQPHSVRGRWMPGQKESKMPMLGFLSSKLQPPQQKFLMGWFHPSLAFIGFTVNHGTDVRFSEVFLN